MIAGKIVNTMRRITRIWYELDFFAAHGRPLNNKKSTLQRQINELSIREILILYDNLPPLISRWKKKLATLPEGKEKTELQMNLELKISELNAIKALKQEHNELI